jgi:circadian clock protein KaiB
VNNFVLRLYIAGNSAISQRAQQNLARLKHSIGSSCRIEVIDVLTRPELAEEAGVLATPTLSYEHPERPRRIVGDLGDIRRVLQFLGIEAAEKSA